MTPKIFPVKTEKTFKLANKGMYTFATMQNMDKSDIITAIKEVYGVDVVKLTTLVRKGKQKRNLLTRKTYTTPEYKKVYVRLADGQSLDLFK
jgi:large subunit ribosomal protein L23